MAKGMEMTVEMYLVLTPYKRALVHAIQNGSPGVLSINWKALADDIKVLVNYLKALCTIPLPKTSNEIPMSWMNRAIREVEQNQVLLPY
jgi:hypothetical protein